MEYRLPNEFHIDPMSMADLELAVSWAAQEGWNPGLNDSSLFYACDPGGFFMAHLGDEPVGSVSAVSYGGEYGFLGFYIVKPEHRGHGFGIALARHAVDRLDGMVMGLDGVMERVEDYRRSGFELAFKNHRFQSPGGGEEPLGLTPLNQVPLSQVQAFDRECFPADRSDFIAAWLSQPGAAALGRLGPEGLKGFGVMRPCASGFKIGPLFANDPECADMLFRGLRASAPDGEPVYLDVPGNNPAALELAQRHGMQVVFETARMYMNGSPKWNDRLVYGITTFELG